MKFVFHSTHDFRSTLDALYVIISLSCRFIEAILPSTIVFLNLLSAMPYYDPPKEDS